MSLLIASALVVSTVAIVLWLEHSNSKGIQIVLNWFPAILFAYVVPAVFTHSLGWDLSQVELHSWSKNVIMPMAIVLVMSALSVTQLKNIGHRPIGVFALGSLAIATLPFLLIIIFGSFTDYFSGPIIDNGYWQGLVPIVGSWIGGSTSQLVLKEVVQCPEGIFLAVLIMDNVIVNVWTIIMFQAIQKSDVINHQLRISDVMPDYVPDQVIISKDGNSEILTVFLSIMAVVLSYYLIDSFLLKIIVLSITGLVLGNFIKSWNHSLVLKYGGVLIILIMAILGLKLNFNNFSLPIPIVIFCIIWLLLHYIIMTVGAYVMKLHMAWVPIASMANVGGISTAPAVTKAFNEEWMPHAILLAILSMVTGTTWGLLTIWLFKTFLI